MCMRLFTYVCIACMQLGMYDTSCMQACKRTNMRIYTYLCMLACMYACSVNPDKARGQTRADTRVVSSPAQLIYVLLAYH